MRVDLTIPEDAPAGRFGVYVLTDANDEVLYIGHTRDLFQRLKAHRSTQLWWSRVRNLEWSACDGPDEARAVEKSMISTFKPEGNQADLKELPHRSHQTLPPEVVAQMTELHEVEARLPPRQNAEARDCLDRYMAALKGAGWTLEAIGRGLNMTRERARQRIARASSPTTTHPVPAAPARPRKPKPALKFCDPDPAAVAELLALKSDAMSVRGWTPLDCPTRDASRRYSELLAEQIIAGTTAPRLAKALGVSTCGITFRIARHGYIEPIKGLPNNTPFETRVWTRPKPWAGGECSRGHDITNPQNVRHINGDPHRPICKPCERIRVAEYKARQEGAA